MQITTKLTIEYLKKNKKRTIGTIIAVILVSILITTLLIIFTSYQNYRETKVRNKGNWEAEFLCLKYSNAIEIEKNKDIKECSIWYDYGMSEENLSGSTTYVKRIHLLGYDENKIKNSGIYLQKGRMPENSNEIIVDEEALTLYGLKERKKIGDELELTFEGETKKYKIVGIAEKIEENTHNPNFSDGKDVRIAGITFLERENLEDDEIVNMSILMKNTRNIYDVTSALTQKLRLEEIPNTKKVIPVNRDKLEKSDDSLREEVNELLGIIGIIGGDLTPEMQELEMPTDKVIYNEELLEILGSSANNNASFHTFILIRNSCDMHYRTSRNDTNYYKLYNNI